MREGRGAQGAGSRVPLGGPLGGRGLILKPNSETMWGYPPSKADLRMDGNRKERSGAGAGSRARGRKPQLDKGSWKTSDLDGLTMQTKEFWCAANDDCGREAIRPHIPKRANPQPDAGAMVTEMPASNSKNPKRDKYGMTPMT